MIKLKTLTVRNFLSVGNATQAVDFDKDQLTLVLGENLDHGGDGSEHRNGTGKTSLINALSFSLYGQALTNIKKDNLVNKINAKNMIVTIDFEKDGIEYRIERGRKPSILKFYINNQEQECKNDSDDSQGDSRETQKEIDTLLGMSHDMFKHIVALNTYTEPFLSMRAHEQRAIIEQLLGITLLSEKADALKDQIRESKDAIFQETTRIEAIKTSNQRIQESINSLKLKQSVWQKQRSTDIAKIEKAIQELSSIDITAEIAQHDKLKVYTEHAAKIKSLNKERATLETAIMQADKTQQKYAKELQQLEHNKCPTCDQELHDHKHDTMKVAVEKNFEETNTYLSKLGHELLKVTEELDMIGELEARPATFYDTVDEAYNHRSNLENLEGQLKHKQNEKDTYSEQIDELGSTALQDVNWDTINSLTAVKEHQEFLLKLLTNKDSFIRKKIIDQNLSYLNHRLTYYLDKVGLPHSVVFQNDLTVEISQVGQSLDFDNLSRGERTRLILGLSWAFRDVWENLYQSVNLLFIDELIDSGLDSSGIENTLSVLKKMGRESKRSIWFVSHREELVGRINQILRVVKENNFTTYSNDLDIE